MEVVHSALRCCQIKGMFLICSWQKQNGRLTAGTWELIIFQTIIFRLYVNLVGGFNPSEKILVNLDIFPQFSGENSKKIFELPPPSR